MLKKLKRSQGELINHDKLTGDFSNLTGNAKNIKGEVNLRLSGDISGLRGDISGLRGDISPELRGDISPELRGDISPGLRGDISGLFGECTDITGNLDNCKITDDERENGVDIDELVAA